MRLRFFASAFFTHKLFVFGQNGINLPNIVQKLQYGAEKFVTNAIVKVLKMLYNSNVENYSAKPRLGGKNGKS